MIGIVLWRDVTAGKAIIWCEDQGDLAFYSHPGTLDTFAICVGDWVSFGLRLQGDVRLAETIQVLLEPGCPELVEDLVGDSEPLVIPFVPKPELVDDAVAAPDFSCREGQDEAGLETRQDSPVVRSQLDYEAGQDLGVEAATGANKASQNVILFPAGRSGTLRSA